jgi:hypothetical protein
MSTKLKVGALVVLPLGLAAFLQSQQLRIKRLVAENAGLRSQLNAMASLQETNGHLAQLLKTAAETSQAGQNELLRLRGQMVRLRQAEQEIAQLEFQRHQLDHPMQQAQFVAGSSQPGEVTAVSEVAKTGNEIPDPRMTDLGMLELSDGVPTRFDLGGGTNCIVTPAALSDGNSMMQITVGVTNADGTVSELGASRITALPGQHCSISVGDRMIALAVKLKGQ